MKYKVTFRKRFTPEGEPADDPKSLVSTTDGVIAWLAERKTTSPAEGVVEDEEFVEIIEPAGLGVAEDLNAGSGSQESNDNGFLGFGTETWVFDVAEGREKEFTDALVESQVVLDFEEVPDESLTT